MEFGVGQGQFVGEENPHIFKKGEVMVDFGKLRGTAQKHKDVDPRDIFRRLRKPSGINDLYTSQAEVLQAWFERRYEKDIVVKLHTGGGKTLVGLLMAQSTINETGEPVLYLAPTVQLVKQTLEKAKAHGIAAVAYETGRGIPLNDDFVNSKAIMVGTYKALFNGRSKFKLRGNGNAQKVGAVILDDAHAAFSEVRESFTLEVSAATNKSRYQSLVSLFRQAFKDTDRIGTFDDVLEGRENTVLEVPYQSWIAQLDVVLEQLKSDAETYWSEWPLLRDHLAFCHAMVSAKAFTITPILPFVDLFPTFSDAQRRIYMSATIADDSEIVRTFDAKPESVLSPLTSRSLAGVSERMILIPDLMKFSVNAKDAMQRLAGWTANKGLGAVVLTPSDHAASLWAEGATVAKASEAVERLVSELQERKSNGPVVFANRYDGIDLAGDSCRLLILSGLPSGTSAYELYRAAALNGGATITRMLAQRIEQGIGRGARGAGDHCVVILLGSELAAWIAKATNFRFLTSATRAQLEMGAEISANLENEEDIQNTVKRSFDRDSAWIDYHAEFLADYVTEDTADLARFALVVTERKAFNNWRDGYPDKAIAKIRKTVLDSELQDPQIQGWMLQFAARIAFRWGNKELADELQQHAYALNRNLLKPKVVPPYRPLSLPGAQARAIVSQVGSYKLRNGLLKDFEVSVAYLQSVASSNQFEQALADLAIKIGLAAERFDAKGDVKGVGPDVLWLLPDKTGFVIEAKSRKSEKNALTKEQHGQLLVAAQWFQEKYPGYECIKISVHPTTLATDQAIASSAYALTFEKVAAMVSDARELLATLCNSQLGVSQLEAECERLLGSSRIRSDRLITNYLQPFESVN